MAAPVGGDLRRAPKEEALLLAAAAGFLGLTIGVPLVGLAGGIDWRDLDVLGGRGPWVLLARSVALATAVTAGAVAWGAPLGAIFARARLPLRRLLFAIHLFPLFLPPFFQALGWFHLLDAGRTGGGAASALLFGPVGAWGVLVTAFTPVVTTMVAIGILTQPRAYEDAALVAASPRTALARIVAPAARAQLTSAALLVFALSFGELGACAFLRVGVYPTAIFARLGGFDASPGEAGALSLPIAALALLLTAMERRAWGPGLARASSEARTREPLDLGRLPAVVALAAALLSGLPLLALCAGGAGSLVASTRWIGASLGNSLFISVAAALAGTPVAIVVGHAVARERPLAAWMDSAAVFVFLLPPAVLGTGLMRAWNRPATAFVYASEAIVVVAFLARYLVVAVRAFAAAVQRASPAYEHAAAVAGAALPRTLLRIVVPMHARATAAAFALLLVFCLRDVDTSILFYPPGGEPLPVRIFTLEANGPPGVVAGLAAIQVLLTGATIAAFWRLSARRPR